ncbi:S1C family serine protease [Thermodesulfatator atlanticus]|uniref:S1C family serine protease n=1 Tax=Thermodesulfatator atlanticus TaxID=501497 RepID=UPI0003B54BD6|nr:PDZ domain-containing protein [Thermodesulfatator atlanticus]
MLKKTFVVFFLFFLVSSAVAKERSQNLFTKLNKKIVTVIAAPVETDFLRSDTLPAGVASGVLVSSQGHVLVPAFLVQGARWIDVVFYDGTFLGGKLLGVDRLSGLALLKVKLPKKILPVSLARQDVYLGQDLFLVTRPRFKLCMRKTTVIEAPASVKFSFGTLASFYATDLNISFCGSGPVFNEQGELVGFALNLPNFKFSSGQKLVPSHLMRLVISDLMEKERVVWPWLGIEGLSLNPSLVKLLDLPFSQGLLITKVLPGSPARKVGLRGARKKVSLGNVIYPLGGDIIISIDGQRVTSQAKLEKIIFAKSPGDLVTIKYWRGKKMHKLDLYLGRRSFLRP